MKLSHGVEPVLPVLPGCFDALDALSQGPPQPGGVFEIVDNDK